MTTYPISCDREFHSWMNGTSFHTKTLGMRIGPEIVLRFVESVWFEGDALSVAHANRLQQHAATLEQMPAAAGGAHAIVETRNDAGINVGP